MQLPDVQKLKSVPFQPIMTVELAERWARIPYYPENDPAQPEWNETPTKEISLEQQGYGIVHVKDESSKESNPTGTIKCRPSWEAVTKHRDFSGLGLRRFSKDRKRIETVPVPRFTVVTSGNEAHALSYMFEKYDLPPPKALVDTHLDEQILNALLGLRLEVYRTDLNDRELSGQEIATLTGNKNGIELTSAKITEPAATHYDWHVHEAFNQKPKHIYVPYGSGRLFENYLTWQQRNLKRESDPRLHITRKELSDISIHAAEPSFDDPLPDKLTKRFNPFTTYGAVDIGAMHALGFTGRHTGIVSVAPERISEAYALLRPHLSLEPSAATGLAAYLDDWDAGRISPGEKALIVSTGKGLYFGK